MRLTENAVKDGLLNKDNPVIKIRTEDGFDLKIVTDPEPLNHTCELIENSINKHVVTAHPIREVKK